MEEYPRGDVAAQKELIARRCPHLRGDAPNLLAALSEADDLYFGPLGLVENQRELMTAAQRLIMAAKLGSVLSARMAIRLNSLSLQKKFSTRWRHL
jgi:hypothetical protein